MLDPVVTKTLIKLDQNVMQYETANGETLVKLTRALYGCLQSALLWFNKLKTTLEEAGFVPNTYDTCILNKINRMTRLL